MTHVPALSHIPHSARTHLREALSSVFRDINFAKSEAAAHDAFTRLFAFAPCLLAAPKDHNRSSSYGTVSLSVLVKERLGLWNVKAYGRLWKGATRTAVFRTSQKLTASQQHKSNADRAIRLAREGAYSRVAQALGSAGVHEATPEVVEELKRKHPQAEPITDGEFAFPVNEELPPLPKHREFSEEEVLEAVKFFPKAVAAGSTAFSATHFLELLRVPSKQKFGLLSALTRIVNILAVAAAPKCISQWISAAPVTPLRKRDNGVRPIAVGETLRRLVGKLWMARVKVNARNFLGDSRVCVARKGGREAVSRRAFLRVVRRKFPELYA